LAAAVIWISFDFTLDSSLVCSDNKVLLLGTFRNCFTTALGSKFSLVTASLIFTTEIDNKLEFLFYSLRFLLFRSQIIVLIVGAKKYFELLNIYTVKIMILSRYRYRYRYRYRPVTVPLPSRYRPITVFGQRYP
jgi:hypothetical protein